VLLPVSILNCFSHIVLHTRTVTNLSFVRAKELMVSLSKIQVVPVIIADVNLCLIHYRINLIVMT